MIRTTASLGLLAALLLAGCATRNPDEISRYEAQRLSTVVDATVLSVRPVMVSGQQSGAGAVAGGTIGAIAGGSAGNYRNAGAYSLLGAVAGALLGNAIEYGSTQEASLELLVQLRNGERRAIVQGIGSETFRPGDAVMLVNSGGRVRVMRTPDGVPVQPAPVSLPTPVPGIRS